MDATLDNETTEKLGHGYYARIARQRSIAPTQHHGSFFSLIDDNPPTLAAARREPGGSRSRHPRERARELHGARRAGHRRAVAQRGAGRRSSYRLKAGRTCGG